MGRLVDGEWVKTSIITSDEKGEYDRLPRTFLNTISEDDPQFQPESGRYHLYVSFACPWAHRTLLFRSLKGLENHISVDVVDPDMLENGWTFQSEKDGATGDRLYGKKYLYEIYQKADAKVSTSVTVPVLWDKKLATIVNNESSEIIRIFNKAFNSLTGNHEDFYPDNWQKEIDLWNEEIYHNLNNGVYKTGFAKNQEAYEKAFNKLFATLDKIENHLQKNSFLVGDQLTEADLRLLPSLLRFDAVYYTHFKCNLKRITDYPNLSSYLRRIYEWPAVKNTTHFDHIKRHYYYSHKELNPYRIVPLGPKDIF